MGEESKSFLFTSKRYGKNGAFLLFILAVYGYVSVIQEAVFIKFAFT